MGNLTPYKIKGFCGGSQKIFFFTIIGPIREKKFLVGHLDLFGKFRKKFGPKNQKWQKTYNSKFEKFGILAENMDFVGTNIFRLKSLIFGPEWNKKFW